MRKPRANFVIVAVLLLSCGMMAQGVPATEPLSISTETLPAGIVGQPYRAQIVVRGGVPPYNWRLDPQSKLPPGLTFNNKGMIQGTPSTSGEFRFTIEVTDSATETHAIRRQFTIVITTVFSIEWRKPPGVRGDVISGEVVVSNNTDDRVDLTVIIVAVNEINKAFALGYQHTTMSPRSKTPLILFGSTLPYGRYVVHADAIGEAPGSKRIYRSRLQTSAPFVIASGAERSR